MRVSERGRSCFVSVSRLPYGVDRAEFERLIGAEFDHLGPVELVVAKVEGSLNQMRIVFIAMKFAPSRCPACECRFDTPESFGLWAGSEGNSFVEAQSLQLRRYPELFAPVGEEADALVWENPLAADFIRCAGCHNKTLRIALDQRTVGTRQEAERLLEDARFTCVRESEIFPGSTLEAFQEAERRMREQRAARPSPS